VLPTAGHWLEVAKHALQRTLLVTTGLLLLAAGAGMAFSVVLLPMGVALACIGIGVIAWGSIGDLTN
jgi:thiol:disulfide interchange protein